MDTKQKLYDFTGLSDKLDQSGYPKLTESRFQVVRKDLTEEDERGNVKFKDDGVYLTINGIEHKGYMYIKAPDVARYGYPSFHITNCHVIDDQRFKGRFDGHYFWHNSNTVDLEDRVTKERHDQVELRLCSKCRAKASVENYNNSQGFFDLLDIQEKSDFNAELDIFGYVKSWRQISKKFRIENNFTCNNCNLKIEKIMDQRYIQVHHKNGNKQLNARENLECLCTLCHANVDATHQHNFQSRRSIIEIRSFVAKYKEELVSLNNPYIKDYLGNE